VLEAESESELEAELESVTVAKVFQTSPLAVICASSSRCIIMCVAILVKTRLVVDTFSRLLKNYSSVGNFSKRTQEMREI
jgi:hypothetical protein